MKAPASQASLAVLLMHDSLEERLQATLNMIPAYTWYAAPSGALTFANERTADYIGLAPGHPLRRGIDTGAAWDSHIPLLHPDDADESRRVWSECLRTGRADEVNFRVRDAEGGYRWFVGRAEPLRSGDGTLLYWIGINLDIEERKRAEAAQEELTQALSNSEETLRLLVDGIAAVLAAMTPEGKVEFVNKQALDYFGMTPEELRDWRGNMTIHPDDFERVAALWEDCLQTGRPYEDVHRLRRFDGTFRWFRARGSPSRNPQGDIVRWYVVLTDIDESERAKEKRKEQEKELRQVLDLAPQMVAVFGQRRERLYANRVALAYLGATLDEWRQKSLGWEVHADDAESLGAAAQHGLSTGSAYELELRLRRFDGTYRWFLARYSPVCDDQGQATRWYVACADIEDRKRAEERLQQENVALREEIDKASMFEEIVGSSPALIAVLSRVSKVAVSASTVLIAGETGTGKELIARAIHRRSGRSARAFVTVNCAAIPRELIASELFGHEKGAFTGAVQRRIGRFELANGGTIFLDEVGELSPDTQVALLRVLQEREFERVGGGETIRVDVRVIAATNRDLADAVAAGTFRHDLFFRLNVFPLEMPALRERKQDIPVLVEYFIHRYARRAGKTFRRVSKRTLERLRSYPWPGNVRELQNVIERSVILCDSDEFEVDESWLPVERAAPRALTKTLAAHERVIIEQALRDSSGRVFGPSGAATRLGIPRSTLESRIRALGINKSSFRAGRAKASQ
jgi:formate hydrogenlyase transcriptional activator